MSKPLWQALQAGFLRWGERSWRLVLADPYDLETVRLALREWISCGGMRERIEEEAAKLLPEVPKDQRATYQMHARCAVGAVDRLHYRAAEILDHFARTHNCDPAPFAVGLEPGAGPVGAVVRRIDLALAAPPEERREVLARSGPQGVAEAIIVWYHGGRSYSTNQVTPVLVRTEQHNALGAFLDGKEAKDTKTLEKAGVSNVTTVMNALAERFPGAVRRPKRKGEGYFVRVRTLPATATN
jgi:hypothetical protein